MTDATPNPKVEYRGVPGWPGYHVGSDGSVWSSREWHGSAEWRQLRPALRNGYLSVRLYSSHSERVHAKVHVLVLLAFTGPRPDGMQACHNNGNRLATTARSIYVGAHVSRMQRMPSGMVWHGSC